MTSAARVSLRWMDARSYGAVFDTVAVEYDRHRPTYPDVLIDRACEAGGLATDITARSVGSAA